ncbi:MAG: SRPBCC family protein [Deltaproteobacteria bacterium]|nr:SRPBCC family protein [Deltaproteobacteria bacterium]
MAEAEYVTRVAAPVARVWEFVHEMDNWAAFLRGYQSHEKQGERDSIWVLKGDVGAVTRTVKFHVHIDEWDAPAQVRFTLRGLNEEMNGGGSFLLQPAAATASAQPPGSAARRPGWFARLVRWAYRRIFGRSERAAGAAGGAGDGAAGAECSQLGFQLRIAPGGPMGPLVDAMLNPLMLPVAEELAEKIAARLEERAR